jgi:hypothetical protein
MSWTTCRKLFKGALVWVVVMLLTLDSALACRLLGRRQSRRSQCCPPAPPVCEVDTKSPVQAPEVKGEAAPEKTDATPPEPMPAKTEPAPEKPEPAPAKPEPAPAKPELRPS